jgi:hypothetical protein
MAAGGSRMQYVTKGSRRWQKVAADYSRWQQMWQQMTAGNKVGRQRKPGGRQVTNQERKQYIFGSCQEAGIRKGMFARRKGREKARIGNE